MLFIVTFDCYVYLSDVCDSEKFNYMFIYLRTIPIAGSAITYRDVLR